jgi:hypothetical protein
MASSDPALARRQHLHEFVTARGWVPDDESGPDAGWHYPASFGGTTTNQVADATPARLTCYFSYDDAGDAVFAIVPAGNLHGSGCAVHDTAERHLPLTAGGTADLAGLAPLLDDLEPRARDLDPRALVECLYFGPCDAGISR